MKFTFIANACGIFTGSKGTRLLTDPWLNDGVFEGSWCHYPPLKTQHNDLQNVDAIYLSHIHPDHYDERFFNYPKDVPIFLLKSKYNFLSNNLQKKGYTNLISLESGFSYSFKEITVTIFEPFAANVFYESTIGNLIDSALIVEDIDGTKALNANDNTPDKNACEMLKDRFGKFDLAMINYNAAGPFPSCFRNLSKNEKLKAHKKVIKRNIEHLIECCDILEPKKILPFAGAYVIGGKEFNKNEFLGTTTWDHCANEITESSIHSPLTLRERDTYDLLTLKSSNVYIPVNVNDQQDYISKNLSKIKYPYELDPEPDRKILSLKVKEALSKLKPRCLKYGLKAKSKIEIFAGKDKWIINHGEPDFGVKLDFYLDQRLLARILDRISHWNNSEIGCHIEIDRKPDIYEIDAHTMMQFFHC